MSIENINPKHPAYGLIAINTYQSHEKNMFGQDKLRGNAITISIEQANLDNPFGHITQLGHGKTVSSIDMTVEQWSTLLLNKNNQNGTPVTIIYGEHGRSQQIIQKDKTNTSIFDVYKQNIHKKFIQVAQIEKELREILKQDKISAADKKTCQSLFTEASTLILKEKETIEQDIDTFISNVNKASEEKFLSGVKENIFNIEKQKKLTNNNTQIIENDFQGVLVLNTVENVENTLIKDFEANFGISLSLYKAVVVVNGKDSHIEKTNEKVFEIKMSHSQFSKFMTSFGHKDTPCTISHLYGNDIEPCLENINDEVEDLYKLYEHIDNIESDLISMNEELEPLLSKTLGKQKKHDVSFIFEKVSRLINSDLLFHVKNVFTSGITYSIRRQSDVQSGIQENIQKEGLEQFNEKINALPSSEKTKLLNNIIK